MKACLCLKKAYGLAGSVALTLIAAGAASSQVSQPFGGITTVGATAQPAEITLIFKTSGQAASPIALTVGVVNRDFSIADPGTCANNLPVTVGQTCTLKVGFSPSFPGVRQGAVEVLSLDGHTVLASAPLSGLAAGGLPVLVPGEMNTVAGDGQWIYHSDGVLATSAPIFLPNGLAVDAAGNLFLSDSSNNRVRRVDAATGLISTVAGNGIAGYAGDNGQATQAQLNGPTGLALDGGGNLYIADSANDLIRRVDKVTGIISTIAGTPDTSGYTGDGHLGTSATLTAPEGLALTPAGDLLIADSGNAAVRLLTLSSGLIRTVAGTGTQGYNGDGIIATTAQLNAPYGVAARSDGAVAIADLNNHRVRLVDTSGLISTVAGTGQRGFSGDGSAATGAQLNTPAAVSFDPAGDLLIADAGNNRVRGIYGSPGVITTLTGTNSAEFAGDAGPADQASLYGPYGLLFDSTGNIWISDMFHNRVRKISGAILNIAYSPMRVSKTSAPVLEMLYNAGNGNLTLAAPVLHEAALDPSTTTCNTSAMSPAIYCSMGVEFAPTEVGQNVIGSIQWPSNAPNVTPVDNLSGQVLSVEPTTVALVASANPGLLGKSLTLTSTVTSADTGRTGTVIFSEGSQVWCNAAPLALNGTAICTIPSLSLGNHTFVAAYSGDDNNAASNSPSYLETIKQQPALAFTVSPAQAVVTSNVMISLNAADPSGTPTGTVIFYDGATALGSVTLDSTGAATWRTSTLAIGLHMLSAQYSGDSTNVTTTSSTVTEEVVQATTATNLTVSNASPTVGSSVTFSASVANGTGPAPTGMIQFNDGSGSSAVALGSSPLAANGTATLSISNLAPGTHHITAVYIGDTDNATSTSAPMVETVQQIATVTTVATDANPSNAKAVLHLSAAVALAPGATADGPLTGSVTFNDGSTPLGTVTLSVSGTATLAISTLSVGNHPTAAVFVGSVNYANSTSPTINQIIRQTPTQTTLSSGSSSSLSGRSITLQAEVTGTTGTPTGTVSFRDGTTQLGTANLDTNGGATFSTSSLTPGSHNLTAVYTGDTNFSTSTSPVAQLAVQTAQPTLALNSPSGTVEAGTSVHLSATLSSPGVAPTGTLVLRDGNTVLATVPVSSSTSYTLSTGTLALGTHTFTAVYGGDTNNAPASSQPVTVTVQQAPTTANLTSSANPLTQGATLVLNAMAASDSPNLSGLVSFFDGATRLGIAVVGTDGKASLTVSTNLSLGQHSLTASYEGDTNHATSTSPVLDELVVQPATATLTSSNNPSASGQNVLFTAIFAGGSVSPSGTASFRDNGALLATVPLNSTGSATFATTTLSVGTHTVSVSYTGDTNYASITAQLLQTVSTANTQVTLGSSANPAIYGQPLTLSAAVSSNGGSATGTVAFVEGNHTFGTAVLNGNEQATLILSTLMPGPHTIFAQYLGNGAEAASDSQPLKLSVKQTTALTLASSSNPSPTLNPVTFTAILTNAGAATATGSVTFSDGNTTLGTALIDAAGHAAISIPKLTAGSHTVTAAYAGDTADLPSTTTPLTEVVQLRPTGTTVTGSATDPSNPQQVTLIAVVKGEGGVPPSGTVSFTVGSLTLGVANLDETGVATITVIFEIASQNIITSYSGDASYAASHSAATSITAGQAAQFTLALNTANITLVSKQHATMSVALGSIKGFADNIILGCEGLPYAATCTFTKNRLALAANGSASTPLVVDTGNPLGAGASTASSLSRPLTNTLLCWSPASLLLLLCGYRTRRSGHRHLGALLLLVFTLTVAMAITGCGGLSINGTPPGTYTFKVVGTAQGAGTTQVETVTLVVTQ